MFDDYTIDYEIQVKCEVCGGHLIYWADGIECRGCGATYLEETRTVYL